MKMLWVKPFKYMNTKRIEIYMLYVKPLKVHPETKLAQCSYTTLVLHNQTYATSSKTLSKNSCLATLKNSAHGVISVSSQQEK